MNKLIKFRAWNKLEKTMGEPFTLQQAIGSRKIEKIDISEIEYLQYTGLKDRNGKEIYERDILEHEKGEISSMMWIENYACFAGILADGTYQYYQKIDEKKLKIIGNIMESPELLIPPT